MSSPEIRPLALPGVLELRPARHQDERGFFSEVWREDALADLGIDAHFVQDNHSFSRAKGVLRGLHFQLAPFAQAKLVRVSRGSIFDVAVDIRRSSPTFSRWVGLVVSAEAWNQVFIPEGFAHGFLTLEEDCEVLYKATAPYAADCDRAIRFDDPEIGVDWPTVGGELTISAKDRAAPSLREIGELA
ncbi:dTDP-4-dehydrorhamnose 3,5-epimerase [Sphingomonas sp.]|uniref:dTDP-4-dehydrorhamnose 3,5-epimerase n=1 Tax=Sphingomonas sp. TaxID=28214 RepID=UPI0025E01055|nr:dTDP-4-dehydrorhamnose 3,5-epimerase [Sphingomonas sp.]MBV9528571.1 dTDP-4-dehydrorhamnose 3,5-epimerase [Sphingomonas sp.]